MSSNDDLKAAEDFGHKFSGGDPTFVPFTKQQCATGINLGTTPVENGVGIK